MEQASISWKMIDISPYSGRKYVDFDYQMFVNVINYNQILFYLNLASASEFILIIPTNSVASYRFQTSNFFDSDSTIIWRDVLCKEYIKQNSEKKCDEKTSQILKMKIFATWS